MLFYILKLLVILPLIGALAWGSLWLARKARTRIAATQGPRAARIVETQMLGPGLRLAVIEFHGREILVSAGKGGFTRLAEAPARTVEP
ncbi:flagellar biosynthetic protein FliO [Novosphingobium sp. ZN18A2]|uniref:flagellar biosynthetic protein FliO n=1 Tax=Novosphingobium sp. ZN18A2 TaxID=3079861 RepID=UPI0030D229FB